MGTWCFGVGVGEAAGPFGPVGLGGHGLGGHGLGGHVLGGQTGGHGDPGGPGGPGGPGDPGGPGGPGETGGGVTGVYVWLYARDATLSPVCLFVTVMAVFRLPPAT